MDKIKEKAEFWTSKSFDQATQNQVRNLLNNDPETLESSFHQDLAFGTGGMRGIMGVGTNRINKYTLGKNTQGLSNYLKAQFPNQPLKVAIAFDCRHNSKEFAQIVADVFSANGIHVYLFSELRPTPELSFAVRHLNCQSGIVLTASHNPPEYNGYKVYWQDGGQLVPPQDGEIIDAIAQLNYDEINLEANPDLITRIDEDIDKAFLEASVKHTAIKASDQAKANLKIVFTSLHGTSIKLVPDALQKAGFSNIHIVEDQAEPNGDFPTVDSPNPEEPEALEKAIQLADATGADIVIGTDPDCDRFGVAVRDLKGKMVLLNGNQTMTLLTDFLLKNHQGSTSDSNKFIASTVVSTPLMPVLGKAYNVECKLGLTGFKWIAKMIKDNPGQNFIGGGEESFGYMVSDFVRDKDAVSSTLLACEVAASAKADGSSFYEDLLKLYVNHGLYQERMVALVKKGLRGAEEIDQMMSDLRNHPPQSFANTKVRRFEDYSVSKTLNLETNEETNLDFPKSNVLIFYLEGGSKIAARPSGTEPKIKFYVSVNGELNNVGDYAKVSRNLDEKIDELLSEFDFGE